MNIDEFKTKGLKLGGARANLFKVTLTPPTGLSPTDNFSFLCKTTSIPTSTIGPISIPFMGRDIKIAGDRTFTEWSTTIINDEDFHIRNVLEQWMNKIKSHTTIRQDVSNVTTNSYKKDIILSQLSKNGGVIKKYKFMNAFPSTLTEIALDFGSSDIEEYTCTWNYDWWETEGQVTTTSTTTLPGLGQVSTGDTKSLQSLIPPTS